MTNDEAGDANVIEAADAVATGLCFEPTRSLDGSSTIASQAVAMEMVMLGCRKKPVKSQSRTDFLRSVTHLHLAGQNIAGDLELLQLCPCLTVLYVYDNKLSALRGLGGFQRLKGLYAQNNQICQLDDFTAPPALEQLFLNGNRIREVKGLGSAPQLRELNISGQRLMPASRVTEEAAPRSEHSADEPINDSQGSVAEPQQPQLEVSIDQQSLFHLTACLQVLDMSSCGLTDTGLKELVVLQGLQTMDLSRNALTSVQLLQMMLVRMPCVCRLNVAGNAQLLSAPKWRERLILAGERLEHIDDKPVTQHQRAFLQSLAARSQRRSLPRDAAAGRGRGDPPSSNDTHAEGNGRRTGTFDPRPSYELHWEGLGVGKAPGMRPERQAFGHGQAMPSGKRLC